MAENALASALESIGVAHEAYVIADTMAPATSCGMASLEVGALVTCGETTIGVLTSACVHEHVERIRVCAGCAAEVQRAGPGWGCCLCDDGPAPHQCEPLVAIDWDNGGRVVVQEGPRRPNSGQTREVEN
jgi:hypothetical protein